MDRLIFKTDDIKEAGMIVACAEPASAFAGLRQHIKSGEFSFLKPLDISLKIRRVGDIFEVEGLFETRVRLTCSRCLDEFESVLSDRFATTFVPEPVGPQKGTEDDEIELKREEMSITYFSGKTIDLHPAIEDPVIMAFPIRAICKTSCKGLCPQCGADLNREPCGCAPLQTDNRFATLKTFEVKQKT